MRGEDEGGGRSDKEDRVRREAERETEPTIPKAEVRVFGNSTLSAET